MHRIPIHHILAKFGHICNERKIFEKNINQFLLKREINLSPSQSSLQVEECFCGCTFTLSLTSNENTKKYFVINFHSFTFSFFTISLAGNENAEKYFCDQLGNQRPPPLQLHHTLHPGRLPHRILGIGTGNGELKLTLLLSHIFVICSLIDKITKSAASAIYFN